MTKTYSWTMANLLAGVDSSDANDTDVSYYYTGDLKRLWRFEDGELANSYQWDAGFDVVAEAYWEDWSVTGEKAYAAGLAEVDVTGAPSYAYTTHDHLGSTRGMWNGSIVQSGAWEFTPYGAPFTFAGPPDVTQLYTGHDLDPATGHYYAPFRFLNTKTGRWLSRDPLGMVDGTNMYGYAGNPVSFVDLLGLDWIWDQPTGDLFHFYYGAGGPRRHVGRGYSGFGEGLNNPDLQDRINVGPIPRGRYTIGPPRDSRNVGPFALPLMPDPSNEMFNRSDFLIHGDNPRQNQSASNGCIILPRRIREEIANSGDDILEVR